MGNDNAVLAASSARRFDAGEMIGPRVVSAGGIEGRASFGPVADLSSSDIEGVKKAIDWYARRGYPQIKILQLVPPGMGGRGRRGTRTAAACASAGTSRRSCAEDVVRQGFDEIRHINQVLLNFFVTPKDDTRTLARFYHRRRQRPQLRWTSARRSSARL